MMQIYMHCTNNTNGSKSLMYVYCMYASTVDTQVWFVSWQPNTPFAVPLSKCLPMYVCMHANIIIWTLLHSRKNSTSFLFSSDNDVKCVVTKFELSGYSTNFFLYSNYIHIYIHLLEFWCSFSVIINKMCTIIWHSMKNSQEFNW